MHCTTGRSLYGEPPDRHLLSQATQLWNIIFEQALEENRFDEALLAIRAECDLWQDIDMAKAAAGR
jgi:hypothetical protein